MSCISSDLYKKHMQLFKKGPGKLKEESGSQDTQCLYALSSKTIKFKLVKRDKH